MGAPRDPHDYVGDKRPKAAPARPHVLYRAVRVLASLRLTVVLFALAMVLVFFGTVAMMRHSIDETMKQYFRSWVVMIDLQGVADFGKVFLGFGEKAELPGSLPFPGGYTLGWLMFINLLAAHAIRFKLTWKRSGIFMLHAGVIILLAGEFLTGQLSIETRMRIAEGESARFAFSLSKHELVVIDASDPAADQVVVVPGWMIQDAEPGEWISHPDLPFDLRRPPEHGTYHINARLRKLKPGEKPIATRSLGRGADIDPRPKSKGTDSDGRIDYPAMYLEFRGKGGEDLGRYLFATAQEHRLQDVRVGDKVYQVTYRFQRTYKPYTVHLVEATHDVYPGTLIPKDYASTVRIEDPELGEHGPIRIWMNHPLYYRGETFYQSSMDTDEFTGVKTTGLQVVRNPAWTAPYLACTLVALGMLVHFLIRLIVFLQRGGAR